MLPSYGLAACAALTGVMLAAGTAPGAAQGQHPSSILPGGASSLQENYQDWQVACAQQAGTKRCAMIQQQTDAQTRQRMVAIELVSQADKVDGLMVLPFGLNLDKGVTLQIDDATAGLQLRFRTCLATGCLVPVSFDARTLALLRKATAFKIKGTADNGQDATFTMSLKGFAASLDRVLALTR